MNHKQQHSSVSSLNNQFKKQKKTFLCINNNNNENNNSFMKVLDNSWRSNYRQALGGGDKKWKERTPSLLLNVLLTDLIISVNQMGLLLKYQCQQTTFSSETHLFEGLTFVWWHTSLAEKSLIDLVVTHNLTVWTLEEHPSFIFKTLMEI